MSLKERLARYLRNNHGWIPKGEICDLAREKTGATGEHTGRRLRELTEEGILEVQYRKGHAYYRLAQKELTLFAD
jgi:DNA-binding transcriptional ArsR family regulator